MTIAFIQERDNFHSCYTMFGFKSMEPKFLDDSLKATSNKRNQNQRLKGMLEQGGRDVCDVHICTYVG